MADVRRSAAYRIALTYSAAFALAIALLGIAVYFAADADFRRQQDAGLAEETAELVRAYRTEGLAELRETIAARQSGGGNAYGYALLDARGGREAGALDTPRIAPGWRDIIFTDPDEGADPARALATDLGQGRTLIVAIDSEALERIDGTILLLFGAAFLAVVALGGLGGLLLGHYLQRRLARISDTARAIVGGDLSQRIPIGVRGDEFDALGASLNAMLDRIAQLLDNLRQVSGDVAHDLRTPLARLRGSLEVMLEGPVDRAALKSALRQSDEILSLFAAILRISEVEGGMLGRAFAPMDIGALAADICETYAPAVTDHGRTLRYVEAVDAMVRGDRELIAQALINLLDNAQLHTPAGSSIVVAVTTVADRIMLSVSDNGRGVAEVDRERIVRRFVRLEESRTRPGNGLGLNLVTAIAAAHGGSLTIEDNAPGLRAVIALPRLTA